MKLVSFVHEFDVGSIRISIRFFYSGTKYSISRLRFGDLRRDAIHVSSTLRRQLPAAICVLFHQRHLLQSLIQIVK